MFVLAKYSFIEVTSDAGDNSSTILTWFNASLIVCYRSSPISILTTIDNDSHQLRWGEEYFAHFNSPSAPADAIKFFANP